MGLLGVSKIFVYSRLNIQQIYKEPNINIVLIKVSQFE